MANADGMKTITIYSDTRLQEALGELRNAWKASKYLRISYSDEKGRKFIGIEREPKYFDIACKRIEAAAAQGDMFLPPMPKPEQASMFGDAA